jgi:hypothetical protein
MMDKCENKFGYHKLTLYSHLLQGIQEQNHSPRFPFFGAFPELLSSKTPMEGWLGRRSCFNVIEGTMLVGDIIHPPALMVPSVLAVACVGHKYCVPLCWRVA